MAFLVIFILSVVISVFSIDFISLGGFFTDWKVGESSGFRSRKDWSL